MTNRIPRAVGDNADLRGLVQSFLSPKGHLYFRFAFDLPGGQFEYESTEMILRPAEAQFKGSCRDYFPIQKWCRITEGKGSLVLVLPDTPLVDVGSVGLMRFKEKLDQDQSTLLVRAVNLQEWGGTTASPYSKTEDLVVRCALRAFPAGREGVAHEESSARVNAHRFAVRAFPSLVAATVFPRQTGPLPSGEHEFCHCFPHSVEVMAMKLMEEGSSVLLRLRETTGFATQAMLSFPGLSLRRARRAMLTEEPLEDMAYRPEGLALHLAPFAIETLLLDLEMGHP